MKAVLATLMGLVSLSLASVLAHRLGPGGLRLEVTPVLVAYACLALNTPQAAAVSFAAGYLTDLMTGVPTGLYALAAMLTFVVCRVAAALVDTRGRWGFGALAAAMDVVHQLLAFGLLSLFAGRSGGPALGSLSVVLPTAALTGAYALLLWPLFHRLDLAFDREEPGLLR